MEVLYYLHDPAAMLATFRESWLQPGGWAVVGVDHYAEHEDSLDWPEKVGVHMTTLSEAQWLEAGPQQASKTWRPGARPATRARWSSPDDARHRGPRSSPSGPHKRIPPR